ncbi:MAG: hypothetical protein M1814_003273 [Vezdaea aestivalis]|nr:MAG: hypothetical protein M1814_003273 [Vezdaea aestivalis]
MDRPSTSPRSPRIQQHMGVDYASSYSPPPQADPVKTPQSQAYYDGSIGQDTHTPTAAMLPHITSGPSPNIYSADFSPFAQISPDHPSFYPITSGPACESSVPELTSSPSPSRTLSTRSSVSSVGPPESYLYSGPECYSSSVKMEESGEWMNPMAGGQMPTHMSIYNPMYSSEPSWSTPYGPPSSMPYTHQHTRPDVSSYAEPKPISNTERTRKRRRLTTAAEANHTCDICGKLFSRSYNYKAHMDTHNPAREHPHVCTIKNCNKKFVRKTDLLRHHQSVHDKQRNFQCSLCEHMFARKDTLRRHSEDGCSKRFEISSKVLQTPTLTFTTGPSSASSSAMASPESNRRRSQEMPSSLYPVGEFSSGGAGPYGREAYPIQHGPHGPY